MLARVEPGLEVQERIGIDGQRVRIVREVMAGCPFDIGTGVEAACMFVEQFGTQIMLGNAWQFIVALGGIPVEIEIAVGVGGGQH